jgi:hypothetical protein
MIGLQNSLCRSDDSVQGLECASDERDHPGNDAGLSDWLTGAIIAQCGAYPGNLARRQLSRKPVK